MQRLQVINLESLLIEYQWCWTPPPGAKARHDFATLAARLKSCPDTMLPIGTLLKRLQIHDGFEDGLGLGQDGVFQNRLVGDEGVKRADAADRGIKIVE